jgi:hypothetical protein
VLRNIGADRLARHAEEPLEHAGDLRCQPVHPAPGAVGERHHTHSVARHKEDLRVEPGKNPVVLDRGMAVEVDPEEAQPEAWYPWIGLVVGLEHGGQRRRFQYRAVLASAAAEQRPQVAGHVSRSGVGGAASDRDHLVVGDHRGPAGAQPVSRGEARRDPLGSDEVGVGHAEGLEDVLAKIASQGHPAHVLDDLTERGEPVVGVGEPGARLGVDAEAAPVVLGERGHRPAQLHGLAQISEPQQAGRVQHLTDPGGVGQQMPHRRGPPGGLGRDQLVGAQVPVGGGIQVDGPLLPQLHHGDGREGLGDRGDPKDRVLGDRRVRRDVGQAVSVEELEVPIADHAHRQTDSGPAVEDLANLRLHREPVEAGEPVTGWPGRWLGERGDHRGLHARVAGTRLVAAMCLAFQLSGATAT